MIKVLSLFTGIGGLDLGFTGGFKVRKESLNKEGSGYLSLPKTKFKIIFANDIEEGAKKVYIENFDNTKYIIKSIFDLLEEKYKFPNADVIIGGFPCQDFSIAGKRQGLNSNIKHNGSVKKQGDKSRGELYIAMKNVIQQVKPKIFVAENVSGLKSITSNGSKVIDIIKKDFSSIGFDVFVIEMYAPEFGVPQNRRRIIFIGLNKSLYTQKLNVNDLEFNKTHTDENYVNCECYIKNLKEPEITIDKSQKYYSHAKFLKKGQGQIEIDISSIAPTIRAEHHGNIEFRRLSKEHGGKYKEELKTKKERRLTIRECSNIQTFPPNFVLVPIISMSKAYKYIGNAVPPLLGFHIANKIEFLYNKYFIK